MNREFSRRWYLIGLNMYVFPPAPKVGDFEALKKWKPEKWSVWETLKLRFICRLWRYTYHNFKNQHYE